MRDELIAEHVMGLIVREYAGELFAFSKYGDGHLASEGALVNYSTDDDAAWFVLRKMAERSYRTTLLTYGGGEQQRWEVSFMGRASEYGHSISTSFAEAVCVAALRALGVTDG